MNPLPVILDTDIGDDIDDALALALLLNSPEVELGGITTVFVDASRRALLARKMLTTWNRYEVPVAAGCSQPLLQDFESQAGHQFQLLDADSLPVDFEHAVDFLIQAPDRLEHRTAGQPLTLLAIGPLTNIALALAREPRLASHYRLILMGGQGLGGTEAEWNIIGDPEAAAMVFRSGIEIRQIGFDITTQVQLAPEHLAQFAQAGNPRAQFLWRAIQLWRHNRDACPILHDPLAALTLFSDCVEFEPRRARVQLCGPERGLIAYEPYTGSAPTCHVAVRVDTARAIALFMERVLT